MVSGNERQQPNQMRSIIAPRFEMLSIFHVFASIAHFERRRIAERTREGLAAARKRGRIGGRYARKLVTA